VGASLGLDFRVDEIGICDYRGVIYPEGDIKRPLEVSGLRHFLSGRAFLFCGYHLYFDARGALVCFQDIVRFMKNLMYPNVFVKDSTIFAQYDALRILGVVSSVGTFPRGHNKVQWSDKQSRLAERALPPLGEPDLLAVMKTFVRGYTETRLKHILDVELGDQYLDYTNPFTGLDFGRTLRGMLRTFDLDLFYPYGGEISNMWSITVDNIPERVGNRIVFPLNREWDTDLFASHAIEKIRGVVPPVAVSTGRKWMDPRVSVRKMFAKLPPKVKIGGPPMDVLHTRSKAPQKRVKVDTYEEELDSFENDDDYDDDDYRSNWDSDGDDTQLDDEEFQAWKQEQRDALRELEDFRLAEELNDLMCLYLRPGMK